jgi:glycosyltransferase involved in cell wall biosynthesis
MSEGAPRRRLMAFAHGLDDPACRFRIRQYLPCFEQAGWDVSLRTNHPPRPWDSPYRNPFVRALHQRSRVLSRQLWRRWDIRAAAGYDAVLLNRDILAGRVEYEKLLLRRNPRFVFDFDDAIFLGAKAAHIEWICRHAAWVTAGNESLAAFARQFTDRVTVLPTVVDTDAYLMRQAVPLRRPLRVGWLGSDRSIRETLLPHLPMLARLQKELGFELIVISRPRPEIAEPGLRWTFVEWNPIVETRIAEWFDIGIMPLIDDAFQRGKCGCKLLQYMAAGLPVVASPVGINGQLVSHGGRGFLAGPEEQWRHALGTLLADAGLRLRMGNEGRTFVEQQFSRRVWFPVLLRILENVAATANTEPRASASGR